MRFFKTKKKIAKIPLMSEMLLAAFFVTNKFSKNGSEIVKPRLYKLNYLFLENIA